MLSLQIVSPAKVIFEGDCSFVVLPGAEGQLGILPRHAPLLSILRKGTITARQKGSKKTFEIAGGFVEVLKNRVIVLAS
ncbi:MAG: ATP synthase F1 subunit epsilon [Candidatus Omnitrophota bacterium]|nr:MAG: ATP synthase F1 subunit epsilon [Candidatus Omnitrophota bacterium]